MANAIDHLHTLTADIETVTEAGGTTTKGYDKLLASWHGLAGHRGTALDRLTKAVINGDDLGDLPVLASAETTTSTVASADVLTHVAGEVLPALRTEYGKTAQANVATLADLFDATAEKLVQALDTVDPDTAPEALMTASEDIRQAWANIPVLAAQMDAQLPALATAASLATHGAATRQATSLIALTLITEDHHRRRLWEAWENTTSRGGRWAALHQMNVTIEANRDLNEFRAYREPVAIETRYEVQGRGQYRAVDVDPEDADYTPSPAKHGHAFA